MTNEPSPRPWRVGESASGTMSCIHDANGEHIASCFGMPTEADAALIVDAVNERESLFANMKLKETEMRAALEEICNRVSVALNCPRQGRGTRVEIEGLVHDLLKIKECARAAIGEDVTQ